MDRGQIQPWRPNGSLAVAGRARTAVSADPRAELPRPDSEPFSFDELFSRERLTLEDLTDDTNLTAWRLVRHVARLRGLCADDQFLYEATSIHPDPWTNPVGTFEGSALIKARTLSKWPELPLLPPDVPAGDLDGDKARVGYDPREDARLLSWIKMMESAARQLTIGSRRHDLYGLQPLIDPCLCRMTFPAPEDIMLVEQHLVEECLEIHLDKGIFGILQEGHRRWGLTRYECLSLFRLVMRSATKRVSDNPEQNLALMVLRLERIAAKARNTLDLRAEIMALKLMSIIQGLANVDSDDTIKDINDSVRELTERRKLLESSREQ